MAVSMVEQIRPLRRVEYDKLIALGAFESERIELLNGVLVPKSPIGPSHSSSVQKLSTLLLPALLGRAAVRVQSPFAALELSEPEPDIVVAPPGDYDTEHPSEAFLVVEVAESSLARDRGAKSQLYASCGVAEYWVVNLIDRSIEVFSEPCDGTYRNVRVFARGESVRLVCFPDLEVRVEDVVK
jgi:Uma2 family endonuclease